MKGLEIFFLVFFLFPVSSSVNNTRAAEDNNNGVYIVYMGAATSTNGSLRDDHAQLLASVLKR